MELDKAKLVRKVVVVEIQKDSAQCLTVEGSEERLRMSQMILRCLN
jgi:hypothetical protein